MRSRIRYVTHLLFVLIFGLSASYAGITYAEDQAAPAAQLTATPMTIVLKAGDRLTITCLGQIRGSGNTIFCDSAPGATATRTSTPARITPSATPMRSSTPARSSTPTRPAATATRTTSAPATATAVRSLTPTRAAATPTSTAQVPTATLPAATATSAPAGGIYDSAPIAAEILGTCSAQVHDRYVVRGPDGVLYRTWHPQVVDNGAGGTCTFAHEHGVDPATSQLQGVEPIAFDYVAHVSELNGMPMPEAHEGYKVHVVNAGQVNDEGRISQVTALMLFHMGTGGVRRYLAPMHTLAVQAKMPDGSRLSVAGMAETGSAGSICARDRGAVPIGRTVVTLPTVPESANAGQPCSVGSPYEIWLFSLFIGPSINDPLLNFNASIAAFDPITTMDPSDLTRYVYTGDAFSPSLGAPFLDYNGWRGCKREFYVGNVALTNYTATTVWTDAHGRTLSGQQSPATAIRQVMPMGNVFEANSPLRSWQVLSMKPGNTDASSVFKLQQPTCAPGLGVRN